MEMNMNTNINMDSVVFNNMIDKFHERVDHILLGSPDLTQKRIYLSVDNYLTKMNFEIDDMLKSGMNYYDIVTIDLCNRLLKEIYYFEHESGYDSDTVMVKFYQYVQLLKDVIYVIEEHIYEKIKNITEKCLFRFTNECNGNIDNIDMTPDMAIKYIVDKFLTDKERVEYNNIQNILYEWLLMELKVMDYLFHFIVVHYEDADKCFKMTLDYKDRVIFLELVEGSGWNSNDVISRDDAKKYLRDLNNMEDYFSDEFANLVSQKNFESIEEVRKNICAIFGLSKGDEEKEDSEYDASAF